MAVDNKITNEGILTSNSRTIKKKNFEKRFLFVSLENPNKE